jgi:hypothetical protein
VIVTQDRGLAERNEAQVRQAATICVVALRVSVADELEKLDRLKANGSILEQKHGRLRAGLVQ